jgi:hypothetical protein
LGIEEVEAVTISGFVKHSLIQGINGCGMNHHSQTPSPNRVLKIYDAAIMVTGQIPDLDLLKRKAVT